MRQKSYAFLLATGLALKWLVVGVSAVLFVIWLGGSLFFTLAGRDVPPPEFPAEAPLPPDADNACTHIRALAKTTPNWDVRWEPVRAALQGKTAWTNCADVADELLLAHTNAFACAKRFMLADAFQLPPDASSWAVTMTLCSAIRRMQTLYLARARAAVAHGDLAAGRAALLEFYQYARRLRRLGFGSMTYFMGTGMIGRALADAAKPPFTTVDDADWINRLRKMNADAMRESEGLLTTFLRQDCRLWAEHLLANTPKDVVRIRMPSPGNIGAPEMSSSGLALFVPLMKLLRYFPGYTRYAYRPGACIRRRMHELDILEEKLHCPVYDSAYANAPSDRTWAWSALYPFCRNWAGEQLMGDLRPIYGQLFAVRFQSIAYDTMLACRCYRLKHGVWPPSLDALVPEHLAAVPTDPFDGKPLRYDTENHYLWTPGKSGTFNGKLKFGPYGKSIWQNMQDKHWVRFLCDDGLGDACHRTQHAIYVPGWMRTRHNDTVETWASFTNTFAAARCTRWDQWFGNCSWKNAVRNADLAAHRLAQEIIEMPEGVRTNVTLVGHSLGGRIVARALAELAGNGLKVRQGILLGAAIPNSDHDLAIAGGASILPILALCNPKDVTLKYAYGLAGGEPAPAFGTDGSPRTLANVVELPVPAEIASMTEVEAAWGKSDAIKRLACHHALFYLAALRASLSDELPTDRQLLLPQDRVNLEVKVMDAGVWWDLLEETNGWKLERNKVTGHCRILDPEKKRRAWGSEAAMRTSFAKLQSQL